MATIDKGTASDCQQQHSRLFKLLRAIYSNSIVWHRIKASREFILFWEDTCPGHHHKHSNVVFWKTYQQYLHSLSSSSTAIRSYRLVKRHGRGDRGHEWWDTRSHKNVINVTDSDALKMSSTAVPMYSQPNKELCQVYHFTPDRHFTLTLKSDRRESIFF